MKTPKWSMFYLSYPRWFYLLTCNLNLIQIMLFSMTHTFNHNLSLLVLSLSFLSLLRPEKFRGRARAPLGENDFFFGSWKKIVFHELFSWQMAKFCRPYSWRMLRYCARAHDAWEVSVSIGYENSKCDGYVGTCRLSQLVELSVVLSSDSVFVIRFAWSVNKSFVMCW